MSEPSRSSKRTRSTASADADAEGGAATAVTPAAPKGTAGASGGQGGNKGTSPGKSAAPGCQESKSDDTEPDAAAAGGGASTPPPAGGAAAPKKQKTTNRPAAAADYGAAAGYGSEDPDAKGDTGGCGATDGAAAGDDEDDAEIEQRRANIAELEARVAKAEKAERKRVEMAELAKREAALHAKLRSLSKGASASAGGAAAIKRGTDDKLSAKSADKPISSSLEVRPRAPTIGASLYLQPLRPALQKEADAVGEPNATGPSSFDEQMKKVVSWAPYETHSSWNDDELRLKFIDERAELSCMNDGKPFLKKFVSMWVKLILHGMESDGATAAAADRRTIAMRIDMKLRRQYNLAITEGERLNLQKQEDAEKERAKAQARATALGSKPNHKGASNSQSKSQQKRNKHYNRGAAAAAVTTVNPTPQGVVQYQLVPIAAGASVASTPFNHGGGGGSRGGGRGGHHNVKRGGRGGGRGGSSTPYT